MEYVTHFAHNADAEAGGGGADDAAVSCSFRSGDGLSSDMGLLSEVIEPIQNYTHIFTRRAVSIS